ncbi:hypothetical protein [Candidatus Nanohalococcus occultus]|uniref:hypothetical protein n=1 Tax=Candidatus Nanohalococcus occultus TaxID=2978047 RepID=UPI0039E13B9C
MRNWPEIDRFKIGISAVLLAGLLLSLLFALSYFEKCGTLSGSFLVLENGSENYPFLDAPERPGKLHIPGTQFIGDRDGWYLKMCEREPNRVYYGGLPLEEETNGS